MASVYAPRGEEYRFPIRRSALLLAVAVLLVGAMAAFRYLGKGRAPAASDASGSETVVVDSGPVSVLLKETGVVRPRQSVAVKSKV